MSKNITKQYPNRQKADPIVPILASKHRVTPRYVRMVRDGECSNDAIFNDYMELKEWFQEGVKNLLLKEVNRVVPFPNTSAN